MPQESPCPCSSFHPLCLLSPGSISGLLVHSNESEREECHYLSLHHPKPSHGNTDPSQAVLAHEICQAVPEVMQLLGGNQITITGRVYLGFRGKPVLRQQTA